MHEYGNDGSGGPQPGAAGRTGEGYVELTFPETGRVVQESQFGLEVGISGEVLFCDDPVSLSVEEATDRLYGEEAVVLSAASLEFLVEGIHHDLMHLQTVTLNVAVPGVKAGDKIVALQEKWVYGDEEYNWEVVDSTVADGNITITVSGYAELHYVAFVKLPSDPGTEQPGGETETPKNEYVDVTLPETKGKTSAGAEVEISVDAYEETSKVATAAEKEALAKYGESANVLSVVDVDLWNADGKYQLSDGETMTITFNVPGVKAGDKIVALHMYDEANGKWEALKTTVADGKVTATFSSFSPVAFVKLPATAPKTGDTGAFGILAVMAVCGLGLVVINRKKFA